MSTYTQTRPSLNPSMIKTLLNRKARIAQKNHPIISHLKSRRRPIDIQADIEGS